MPWDAFWEHLGHAADLTSVLGLILSGYVALKLNAFRKEVLLRGALEDLDKKLGGVMRNLAARNNLRGDLAELEAHVIEIRTKIKTGAVYDRAALISELLKLKPQRTDDIITELSGLRTALGHLRRDRRLNL
jgi:hypothetical protein